MLPNTSICRLVTLSLLALFAPSAFATNAKVLIYSATEDFRHDSIPTAIQALQSKGPSFDIQFETTEDKAQFTDQYLARYDALLFLDNTGEVLDDLGKAALQKYLDLGGNFIGIHAASDCLRNTTFYGHEVGAFFDYHPALQNATVDVIDSSHPSTSMLPAQWHVQDEMYNFKSDPRTIGATIILSANESSYIDTGTRLNQGTPHPTAWFQERGAGAESNGTAGRSFYTSLGHLNETWQDELFLAHVFGGITWTLQSNTTLAFNTSAEVGNPSVSVDPTSSSSSTTGTSTSSSSAVISVPPIDVLPLKFMVLSIIAATFFPWLSSFYLGRFVLTAYF
ncbi:trehalose utilization-domain-containing protein [Lentinula edodes]|uniref:trehalose utilization-domain-containing protein n=1 Tax=Lentinula edodes TaxID=5353 RepID=UPI001E8DD70B|nr:trehalose utilization-domain-containing protein [Lentinula edodes]KAH7873455.1 trehalose utilization-domain-containing protein [Lentinula edodes]